jgi:hypothetical protein
MQACAASATEWPTHAAWAMAPLLAPVQNHRAQGRSAITEALREVQARL